MKDQLQTVLDRLKNNLEGTNALLKTIGSVERDQQTNQNARKELAVRIKEHEDFGPESFSESFKELQDAVKLTLANIRDAEDQVAERLRRQIAHQEGVANKARNEMLPKMQDFLRDYPEQTANLKAEASFAGDFAAVRERIEREELPLHRQRFEEFLGTNLVGDTAMFQSNLLEHEKSIRTRVDSVNTALRKIPFSETTHVQIVAQPTRADDIGKFRAELKECLAGGLNPSADDRPRILPVFVS